MKGNTTEMHHWTLVGKLQSMFSFSPSLNNIKVNIIVTPNISPCSVWRAPDLQRRRPVSRGGGSRRWCGEGERPLSASPAVAERQPHSAALPPGLHLTLPQSGSSKTGQSRLSATHGISDWRGGGGPATTQPCCRPVPPPYSPHFPLSSLSSLTHRSL